MKNSAYLNVFADLSSVCDYCDHLLVRCLVQKSKLATFVFAALTSASTTVAAPDGKWTLTINSNRPWQMDIAVTNNTPQVLSAHGITPEGIRVRKVTDDRIQFDAIISKQGSCSSGSVMKFDLKFKNGVYRSGSVNGNCIGFPKFRARVSAKK